MIDGVSEDLAMVFVLWDAGEVENAAKVVSRAVRLLRRQDNRLKVMQRKINRMHQMLGERIEKDGYKRYRQIKHLMEEPKKDPVIEYPVGLIMNRHVGKGFVVEHIWGGDRWHRLKDEDGNWTEEAAAVVRKVRGDV